MVRAFILCNGMRYVVDMNKSTGKVLGSNMISIGSHSGVNTSNYIKYNYTPVVTHPFRILK